MTGNGEDSSLLADNRPSNLAGCAHGVSQLESISSCQTSSAVEVMEARLRSRLQIRPSGTHVNDQVLTKATSSPSGAADHVNASTVSS